MIGRLSGEILSKRPPWLLLDVGGVGYELEAPMSTFYQLPAVGERVTLVTHLAVREDAHALYGFMHEVDRSLFRTLLKVSGVGARVALAILSGMDTRRFVQCVEQEDSVTLTRIPGIGKKTAERLIIEMRDRLAGIAEGGVAGGEPSWVMPAADGTDQALKDAISALIALGFRPPEAQRMAQLAAADHSTSEEIIRAALRAASPS